MRVSIDVWYEHTTNPHLISAARAAIVTLSHTFHPRLTASKQGFKSWSLLVIRLVCRRQESQLGYYDRLARVEELLDYIGLYVR